MSMSRPYATSSSELRMMRNPMTPTTMMTMLAVRMTIDVTLVEDEPPSAPGGGRLVVSRTGMRRCGTGRASGAGCPSLGGTDVDGSVELSWSSNGGTAVGAVAGGAGSAGRMGMAGMKDGAAGDGSAGTRAGWDGGGVCGKRVEGTTAGAMRGATSGKLR